MRLYPGKVLHLQDSETKERKAFLIVDILHTEYGEYFIVEPVRSREGLWILRKEKGENVFSACDSEEEFEMIKSLYLQYVEQREIEE